MLANARWMQSTRHPRKGGSPVLREGVDPVLRKGGGPMLREGGDPVLESARYLLVSGLRGNDGRYGYLLRLSILLYK